MNSESDHGHFARIMAGTFAAINAGCWFWYFLQPYSRGASFENGMALFLSAFIMGPGILIFFAVAGIYIGLLHAGLVGPMPLLFSNILMVGCGLVTWTTIGFLCGNAIHAGKKKTANG